MPGKKTTPKISDPTPFSSITKPSASPSPSSISALNEDVLRNLGPFCPLQTLLTLSLVSRQFRSLFQPFIFRSISLIDIFASADRIRILRKVLVGNIAASSSSSNAPERSSSLGPREERRMPVLLSEGMARQSLENGNSGGAEIRSRTQQIADLGQGMDLAISSRPLKRRDHSDAYQNNKNDINGRGLNGNAISNSNTRSQFLSLGAHVRFLDLSRIAQTAINFDLSTLSDRIQILRCCPLITHFQATSTEMWFSQTLPRLKPALSEKHFLKRLGINAAMETVLEVLNEVEGLKGRLEWLDIWLTVYYDVEGAAALANMTPWRSKRKRQNSTSNPSFDFDDDFDEAEGDNDAYVAKQIPVENLRGLSLSLVSPRSRSQPTTRREVAQTRPVDILISDLLNACTVAGSSMTKGLTGPGSGLVEFSIFTTGSLSLSRLMESLARRHGQGLKKLAFGAEDGCMVGKINPGDRTNGRNGGEHHPSRDYGVSSFAFLMDLANHFPNLTHFAYHDNNIHFLPQGDDADIFTYPTFWPRLFSSLLELNHLTWLGIGVPRSSRLLAQDLIRYVRNEREKARVEDKLPVLAMLRAFWNETSQSDSQAPLEIWGSEDTLLKRICEENGIELSLVAVRNWARNGIVWD